MQVGHNVPTKLDYYRERQVLPVGMPNDCDYAAVVRLVYV